MAIVRVKGHEFNAFVATASSSRSAVQFKNAIIESLKKLGVQDSQVEVVLERVAVKKVPASVSWFMDGHYLYYSWSAAQFVENLYVVSKVIAAEVEAVRSGEKTMQDFIGGFSEDDDVEDKRKEARAVLGVSEHTRNLDEINKRYKVLAKEHHPDVTGGSLEKFKLINHAHKTLKRELE